MINGEQLVGKPVFTRTGQKLESIQTMVLDATGKRIIALMIDGEEGPHNPRAISFEAIQTIGPDAIIVAEGVRGLPPVSWPEVLNRLNEPTYVGRDVISATGEHIGQVADLCLNELTGQLEGIEISRGSLADLQGRIFVAAAGVVIGESVVVEQLAVQQATPVPSAAMPGAVRAVSNAGSSLAGVVTGVGESLKDTISNAVSTAGHAVSGVVSNAAANAGSAVQAAASGAFDHAKERLEANQMRYAIGRKASHAVNSHAGKTIVDSGETITSTHAKEALEQGMLQALFVSAGGTSVLNAFAHVKGMAAQTLDRLRGLKPDLGHLEVTLGYTVSRTVYGATDTPIILVGETVGLETIRRAANESFGADLINAVFGEMNPSPSFDDITDDPKADLAVQTLDGDGNPNVQAEDLAALRSAMGQTVPREVLDADGGEVLKTGEEITNDLLEHARAEAVLSELSVAVEETVSKTS